MTEERRADKMAVAILTAILALLFLDVLIGFSSLYVRDISHAAQPARLMLRETVLSGEFPYWNRWISAGQPMAANPANQVFYPLTWLVLLPGYDFGFQLLLVLHVYIAGWSMYAFLRSLRLGPAPAFLGALSFACGGPLLSLHDLLPLLFPIAWTPLICLYTRRFLARRSRQDLALAAFFLGIQVLLGEPTVAFQTGLLLGGYALYHGARNGGLRVMVHMVGLVGLITVLALLIAAVQMLPAIDHASDSVRARGLPFDTVTSWSLPAARLGELVLPNLAGHHQLNGRRVYWGANLYPGRGLPFVGSIYPGILMTILAIAGLLARVRGRTLVVGLFATSVILALGANTPLWSLLYEAGVARSIRYPEKFILMGVFSLIVFGTVVLDGLLRGDPRIERNTRIVTAALCLTLGAATLIAITPAYPVLFTRLWGQPPAHIFTEMLAASRSGWALTAARVALLFIVLRNLPRLRGTNRLPLLLGILVVLDLGMLFPELAPRVSPDFFREPPELARQLPAERASWRLFHIAAWQRRTNGAYFTPQRDLYWIHRNAMYPMMPATWGLQTVIQADYDLTALQPTTDFATATWALSRRQEDWAGIVGAMSNAPVAAIYVPSDEAYSRAGEDRRNVQPARLLALGPAPRYYFADQMEIIGDVGDFIEKLSTGDYSRRVAFTRQPSFSPAAGVVRSVRETPNTARLAVETRGPAFLVMSVTPHKYWRVTLNDAEVQAVVTNVGYQGITIPKAGTHVVEMKYRNPLIGVGGAISGSTLLLLGLFALPRKSRKRLEERGEDPSAQH